MPSYPQGLPDNVTYLQQQILRSGTARLGPVSLKPGEGHIRMNDGTNDTGFLDFNGIQLRYRGSMRGLTALTEDFANLMESHTRTLETNIGRLNGHDAAITRIDAKDAAQDDTLARKAWTTYVDQQDSALSGRISTAQSRADAAHALATGRATVASVTTAQNRANAAYTLAEGRASKAQLNDMIVALNSRLTAMQIWFAAASNGNTPANPPNIPGLPTVPQ